jgi:putative membrane protein
MIANYTDHAANERTFLAWIRTGLAASAFGFFLIKLNFFVDVLGGGSISHLPAEDAGAAAARYAGLAMIAVGIVVIARSSFAFERTRRALIAMNWSGTRSPAPSRSSRRRSRSCADFLRQSRADLTFAA